MPKNSKIDQVPQCVQTDVIVSVFSEQAKEDFHKWFFKYYNKDKISVGMFNHEAMFNNFQNIVKNTYLTEWFREVHNFHSYVERFQDGDFDYVITSDFFKEIVDYNDGYFKTFLEAQNKSIVQMYSIVYSDQTER
jgi:hypothetical protein